VPDSSVRKPLVIVVDSTLAVPVHRQIEEQVQAYIERGDLAGGAMLPTVRQLASDLNIAPNTVVRAYDALREAGWIMSDGRRGTRVASRTPNKKPAARADSLRASIDHIITTLLHRGFSRTEIAAALNTSAHNLSK
jgi:GntR family transcriptional regulator